jgi:hypothetical protein
MLQSIGRMTVGVWSVACRLILRTARVRSLAQSRRADLRHSPDWVLVVLVGLLSVRLSPAADTLILTGTLPRIVMEDNAEPLQNWQIYGTNNGFKIDNNFSTTPFTILSGTPTDTFILGPNAGQSAVGIGGSPSGVNVNLQIFNTDTAKIRLTQTGLYNWDIAADESNFYIQDVSAGHRWPFVIEAGAPFYTLHLANSGSIGLGTSLPNQIGSTTGTGRFLNLRASGAGAAGVANLVAQGNLGGQLHLVHNTAPANQRIIRFQCSSGLASFHVLNDSLTSYAIPNTFNIKMSNGNIGLRVASPAHPLHLASGAHCTEGGVWTNASSRALKDNIHPITSEQARETVRALQPIGYRYKNEPDEEYVGFVAEDVPDLVATNDRKSLAPMDVVAVLTKVVQDQDRINEQQQQLIAQQQTLLAALSRRLADIEQKLGDGPMQRQ